MSNKTILVRLLEDIDFYEANRKDRDGFAQRFCDSIEALEGVPYSVITEMRDWQYRIETEGYFEDEEFESEYSSVISEIKIWVGALIEIYS